ncbi:MAG: DivIVA domain-containing protein, partial [Caldicoprobacterales bacterium]
MKRLFKTSLFGYNRKQVNGYVLSLRKDYERELSKKKDRMLELSQENRDLKSKLLEYEERLSDYEEREIFISKALVKAEESAQAI